MLRTEIAELAWQILIQSGIISKTTHWVFRHVSPQTHAVRAPRFTAYMINRLMIESVLCKHTKMD